MSRRSGGSVEFPAPADPDCRHRSHYECVACRKKFCARCGTELAESSDDLKATGFWCPSCLQPPPQAA